jgi:serine phosphatase RsbU (regulator of sigma subunit)
MGLAALGLIWLFFDLRQRKLMHDKKVLEVKVKERTIELEKKKAQIEVQRDEIVRQNEEITSSITYARRIQEAILPADELLKNNFSEHFVLFKPRDIVSGDFYWIAGNRSFVYFAAADCTGHGVPGAFMSMLGISMLNEITGEGTFDISTGAILDTLRDKIISALHQQGKHEQSSDGMDIALCKYTRKDKSLEYSGAFNPLLHYSANKLTEYKADRQPIGFFEKSKKFTTKNIKIKKGDSLYLFSDGYYDQFGGPNDKRYSTKKLKNTLTGIAHMPMNKQLQQLEENFQLWKGDQDQVDDIIILGLRF